MEQWFIIVSSIVIGGIVLVLSLQAHKRKQLRVMTAWQVVAAELEGGEFIPATGPRFGHRSHRVVAKPHGVPITAFTHVINSGNSSFELTRVVVDSWAVKRNAQLHRLTFRVSREGLLSGLGKLVGAQDVRVDDPAYDGVFVIKTNGAQRLRALLNEEVRQRHLEQPQVSLNLEGAELMAEQRYFIVDPVALRAQIELLVAVARAAGIGSA